MVLVDPITILLSQPDVAYNFVSLTILALSFMLLSLTATQTVREPYTAQEWLIWYYGAKDIGVAHTLGRHFFWHDNILWKEDLESRRAAVFLSSNDCIVDAPAVRSYLLGKKGMAEDTNGSAHANGSASKQVEKTSSNPAAALFSAEGIDPRVLWGQGLDHAQVFDVPAWRAILKRETLIQARLDRTNLIAP